MRKCFLKSPFWLNELLHCEHMYLFPLWVCLWQEMPLLFTNALGHWSQNFWSAIFCFKLFPLTLFHNDWGNHYKNKFQLMVDHFHFHSPHCFFSNNDFNRILSEKGKVSGDIFFKIKTAFWDIEKIWMEFTFDFYPSNPKPMKPLNISVGNENCKSQHTSKNGSKSWKTRFR